MDEGDKDMTGYLLSETGLASRPYYIKNPGINVWSVEELCYFLYENTALIDDGIVCTALTRWLTEEFRMAGTALAMERGMGGPRGDADFLLPLMRDTGWLGSKEMASFTAALKELTEMDAPERELLKAGALMHNGRYGDARKIYRKVGRTEGMSGSLVARAFAGSGKASMALLEYDEALKDLDTSLDAVDDEEVVMLYLMALRISKPDDKYYALAEDTGVEDELIARADEKVKAAFAGALGGSPADLASAVAEMMTAYHRESGT